MSLNSVTESNEVENKQDGEKVTCKEEDELVKTEQSEGTRTLHAENSDEEHDNKEVQPDNNCENSEVKNNDDDVSENVNNIDTNNIEEDVSGTKNKKELEKNENTKEERKSVMITLPITQQKTREPLDERTYEFFSAIIRSSMKDTFELVLEQLTSVQITLDQLRHLMKIKSNRRIQAHMNNINDDVSKSETSVEKSILLNTDANTCKYDDLKILESKSGTPETTTATLDYKAGTTDIKTGTPDIKAETPTFKTETPEIKTGTTEIMSGTPEPTTATLDFKAGTSEIKAGTPVGTPDIKAEIPQSETGTPDIKVGTPTFKTGTPEIVSGKPESDVCLGDDIVTAETIVSTDDENERKLQTDTPDMDSSRSETSPIQHSPQAPRVTPGRRSSRMNGRVKSRTMSSSSSRQSSAMSTHIQ